MKLPSLVRPLDYYLLLLFHVGGNEAAACTPRAIKRDFSSWGLLVMEFRTQVIFSSLLPAVGSDTGRNRWAWSTNTWLHGWCHCDSFAYFDHGVAYTAPGLLAPDGIHLSQREKRVFAHKLAGSTDRALN